MADPVCVADYEEHAKKHLPKYAFEYFAGGADEENTLRENAEVFKRVRVRPRVLCGISQVDLSTTVLGERISMPIGIAPTSTQILAHPDGEKATARAAARSETLMAVSCVGSTRLEDVASAAPSLLKWMLLYIFSSQEITKNLVNRAEKEGYKAIAITVDSPVRGKRRKDMRNNSSLIPYLMTLPNINSAKVEVAKRLSNPEEGKQQHLEFHTFANSMIDSSISFESIKWLKSITKLPILLKGILTADDAIKAVEHGVDGIIVSNHGGRQLDCVPATIDVLQEIVEAVQGRVEVYIDGGIRTGTDVFKALALGARAVFIGRPALWGLVYKGEEGVYKVLEILREEFKTAMILSGCASLADIKPSHVMRYPARL